METLSASYREWLTPVLSHRREMVPLPTGMEPRLGELAGVKVVVFDVYGTLVISGSGDVGTVDPADHADRIPQALESAGIMASLREMPTTEMLHEEIEAMNRDRRSPECPKPEVDIVEVWRRVLARCGMARDVQALGAVVSLAAHYEARANPTWPMPGTAELLAELRVRRLPLGIVSNAQVFTPLLVEDLIPEKNLERGGFDLDFCLFSNRFRQSKPGPRLFEVLCGAMQRRGILPYEAVYVGNDLLNDVWAASQAGLRTAWYVGDARSMRARGNDPRCHSLKPDLVLTSLMQLLECLPLA